MFDGNGACAMDSCLHLADGGGSLWAAEPTSSKDTVSRINSPRNSKSSGTAVRSCDKDNSTDRDLDAVSSRSDQDEQHTPTKSERSGSPMRDALEDISNVLSTTQQESPLGSSIRERSPSSPAAKQASRSPSASQQGAFSNSGAAAERDAVAAEVESRVVSPPEESPDGAACPEALQSGEACEGHSNPELGSSDSFLLSPSNAKPRSKARGSRRPRALAPEMADNAAQKAPRSPVKSEWTPKEQPLEVLLPGLDSTLTARLAEPAELCVLATPAQCEPPLLPCAEVIEDRGDMVLPSASARALMEAESLSRAASAVPGADLPEGEGGSNDGREEGEAEEVVPRRQRASRAKRKPPLSGRRGSRASGLDDNALGAASDDEDYCPPGDADEVAAPKRQRLLRMRTSAPVLSIPEAGTTRGQSRLRWSNTTGCIATPPPLGSPSGGSRRLRSQPVDLTDLRPDAFAFSPPKRGRTSQLQAAVANLEHLRSMEGTKLARSSASGICKPYPLWLGPLDSQLQACSEAACNEAISRHASDRQLLHGPRPPPPSRTEAGHRLGRSPLGKALLQTGEPQVSLEHPDQLLPACRSLFPPFLEPGLAYWEARLLTPCQGAYGETTTCDRARKDRDLHNTWEDLQARHTAEAASLEAFHKWLLPTEDTPDE